MRKLLIMMIVVTMVGVTTLAAPADAASKGPREKVGMIAFADGTPLRGHISIARGADSVDVNAHLRGLNPGHAHTVWAVIWNDPSQCVGGCGEDDLGVSGNVVIFSGIGGVANGGGNLNGNTTLIKGLDGAGPIPGALTDTAGAEIHFVVQDHGVSTGDPAETTTFEGGCGDGVPPTVFPDTCVDVQAAVFLP